MEFRATKDTYERETEETERLVREAPKVKPPRHDRRREDVQNERDPDIDGDPDLKSDPDLSLNYKGVSARVYARFLQADIDRSSQEAPAKKVKVRKKDTGHVTEITKEHFDQHPSDYEVVDDAASDSPAEEKAPPSAPAKPEEAAPSPAESDPHEAVNRLREETKTNPAFANALKKIADPKGFFAGLPKNYELSQIKGLGDHEAIKPFKTIGDLRAAISKLDEAPEEPKAKPKAPKNPVAPAKPPAAPPAPAAPPPPPAPAAPQSPAAPSAPAKPEPEGAKSETPGTTPEKAPEAAPTETPAAPVAPEAPQAAPGKAKPPKPKNQAQKEVDDWLAAKGPDDPKFKEWAADEDGVKTIDDQPLFRGDKGKYVPFDKLPLKAQIDFKERFDRAGTSQKNIEELKNDPKIQDVLKDLANPKSEMRASIEKAKALKKDPRRAIPALKDSKLPEGIDTVEDLIQAAGKIHQAPVEPVASPEPVAPKRPPPTPQESDRAKMSLIENFPPALAQKFLKMNLHPHDVSELMSAYDLARAEPIKSLDAAKEMVNGTYQLDPEKVPPPRLGKNDAGQEVPFQELSPEKQGEALQQHRMRSVAVSLAARQSVVDRLEKKTDGPPELLGELADFTLDRPKGETPQQRGERAQQVGQKLYQQTMASGTLEAEPDRSRFEHDESSDSDTDTDDGPRVRTPRKDLSAGQTKKLFEELGHDPEARQVATSYLQAWDYLKANQEFLSDDEENGISEHQSPRKIWLGVEKAMDFFKERAKLYPPETIWQTDPSADFRHRVVNKIRTLAPAKAPFIQKWNEEFDDEEYKRRTKEWEKTFEEKGPYRENGRAPPPKPTPPPGHDLRSEDKSDTKSKRQALLDEHRRQTTEPEEVKPEAKKPSDEDPDADLNSALADAESDHKAKTARLLARFRRDSSYPKGQPMASADKKAVYWGVEPYPSSEPYPKWTQVHQRDIGESDHNALIKSAREWLRTPVLADDMEGVVRDTQLRAALDLAIRTLKDGAYSVGLQPPIYNMLLARLAGESPNETLLTVHSAVKQACAAACGCQHSPANDSLYAATGEVPPMKASSHIRSIAARYATTHPTIAYDLIDAANKLAQEEQQQSQQAPEEQKSAGEVPPQFLEHMKKKKEDGGDDKDQGEGQQKQAAAFKTLRSHVIQLAHANPHLREAYLPLLQAIKTFG